VNDAAGCSHEYATHGFEPDDGPGARHPLFLYFTGTNFVSDEASFRDQSAPAANAVTKAMAARGFVALWVEYDNGAVAWLSDHVAQLGCLFGKDPTTVLAVACALPQVDCARGIATWGHSQGAYLANRAYDFDDRVRAVWLAGYGGDGQSTMPKNRLRVENGEADTTNGQVATVNQVTGLTTAECPDDGRSQCFRPDGSGWVIVRAKDCVTSTADHCWFDRKTCTDSQVILEPTWIDPGSTKPFALESNADWVAATVARP
jgi:dipeptidyl aminopeptidase/acylaminoacyl peptidase